MKRLLAAVAALVLAVLPAAAQSNIQNARMQERPAADLARTFDEIASGSGPLWIAYAVPANSPDWNSCCGDNWRGCCARCSLEEHRGESNTAVAGTTGRPIPLEGSASAILLYRIEAKRVGKVRAFSDSCQLDAGGLPVYWLSGVNPAASVALLKKIIGSGASDGAGAGDAVPRHLISEALVAITAHQAPEAVTTLIDLARNNPQSRVRSDALFWLAQRAGQKAAGTITDAIANDPDTKVKERAVFALSQMPADEGVPKLIEVARTNRNPRVRQQAVFWLGQSKDPRALKFFEEILLK